MNVRLASVAFTILVGEAVFAGPSNAKDWNFSQYDNIGLNIYESESGEDLDPGRCELSNNEIKIAFIVTGFMKDNIRIFGVDSHGHDSAALQVDNFKQYIFEGTDMEDGTVYFRPYDKSIIQDIAVGNSMTIVNNKLVIHTYNLAGSSIAARQFINCVDDYQNSVVDGPTKLSRQSKAAQSTESGETGELLPYGNKAGMEVTVISKQGLGTSNAIIGAKHTPANAKAFCVNYGLNNSDECVRETLKETTLSQTVQADCLTGNWTDFGGEKYKLLGINAHKKDFEPEYKIAAADTNDILDGSMASGYDTAVEIFKALCPGIIRD